jgi:flagellar biosynthesis protein FlhG
LARVAPDQAEGLRRLFVADVRRMIAVVSNGPTDAGVSARLATTLAAQGLKVLLLDEQLTAGMVHPVFCVRPGHDLEAVLLEAIPVEHAMVMTPAGVSLLAGGAHPDMLTRPRMEARIGLVNAFYRLAGQYDVVLVNTSGLALETYPSFAWACQDVILLCDERAQAATETYAYIKLLHQAEDRRFHLVCCNMAPLNAEHVFRRIASVCRRHLHLMPSDLGCLPAEQTRVGGFVDALAKTTQQWPLPEQQAGHFPALMHRLLRGTRHSTLHS